MVVIIIVALWAGLIAGYIVGKYCYARSLTLLSEEYMVINGRNDKRRAYDDALRLQNELVNSGAINRTEIADNHYRIELWVKLK